MIQTNKNSYPREAYMLEKRERSNKHHKSINHRLKGDQAVKKIRRQKGLGRALERATILDGVVGLPLKRLYLNQEY